MAGSLWRTLGQHADDVLLCTMAFDGVLADDHPDPDRVRLTDCRRARLRALLEIPGVAVAIISGRRVADLAPRVDLGPCLFYIGVHGLEIAGPRIVREQQDRFEQHRDGLHRVVEMLTPAIARTAGARLEEKGAALALHTRGVDAAAATALRVRFLAAAADLLRINAMRPIRGRDVLELLPNLAQPRTTAIDDVRQLVAAHTGRPVFAAYVGPDVADDDAREALNDGGVSIVVGRRGGGRHHLASVAEVDGFLDRVIALRRAGVRQPSR